MPRVGPYQIPFPFTPYPLQEHAMTALRDYLERRGRETAGAAPSLPSAPSGEPGACTSAELHASAAGADTPVEAIAVLESPTGTGKSHMLLNSVLSFLYEPVELADRPHRANDGVPISTAECPSSTADVCVDAPTAVAAAPAVTSLEEALRQRRLADEVAQLRRERRARVREQRRQLRRARKLMRLQAHTLHAGSASGEEEADFLLAQDPLAWYAEQRHVSASGHPSNAVSGYGARSAYALSSSSSASSAASSASDDAKDGDDDSDDGVDAEDQLEAALATLIPLRKPKVYFASRTHTQLRQLMDDLQHTVFAAQPLRPRATQARVAAKGPLHVDGAAPTNSTASSPAPPVSIARGSASKPDSHPPQECATSTHRLTAVHVAGRQHLCLNANLRHRAGGNGDRLNHLCREAMRYERSKEGRARRRRRQQQHSHLTPGRAPTDASDRVGGGGRMGVAGGGGGGLRDLEDAVADAGAEDKGCVYCVESHLRSLMTFLRDEQQQQDKDRSAAPGASNSTIYTMERLQRLGRELQACPYLATRLLLRGADVALVPYSYVLDEGQRAVLLGGVTTKPATAAEAAAVREVRGGCDAAAAATDDGGHAGVEQTLLDSAGAPSLGSVLYHRRQRVTATAAFRRRSAALQQQQQPSPTGGGAAPSRRFVGNVHGKGGEEEEDAVWLATARCAPPSFRGDILVFDEAHNIADQCRATSSVEVASWQLALVQRLITAYVARYESRLLTRNKQRLRELTRFLAKLVDFCERAATGGRATVTPATAPSISTAAATALTTARVWPLHSFIFDAGIDNVDVYAFLVFLVDSQLVMKLQGLVAHCLAAEAQAEVERRRAAGDAVAVQRGGRKRARAEADPATTELSGTKMDADLPPQPHRMTSVESTVSASHTSALSFTTLLAEAVPALPARTSTAGASSPPPGGALDMVQVRAIVADALQRVEKLLCALYVSDNTSTRVLWSAAAAPIDSADARAGAQCGALKLIQLEPGLHTFAPLVREAQAVVLAGGTMQPLAFTCGPLLALPARDRGVETATGRSNVHAGQANTSTLPTALPVHLISEGHVVPAASVQVWALGKGPSGLRLELSQHALGLLRGDAASGAPHNAGAQRALAEVGCTLLNLARVLPPAGVICFFTSYDVMDSVVAVLQGAGYWDQIGAVKRIFRETRGPQRGGGGAAPVGAAAAAEGTDDVLREYQEWIGGDGASSPTRRGAFLFAVMGGRLSEGINFADDLGRAVIVLGMPYANPSDAELQLTLQHIAVTRLASPASRGGGPHDFPRRDSAAVEWAATAALPPGAVRQSPSSASPFTSPEEWGLYMDGMMRTVNQCIGRCIRHAGDYAVIILLDARYAERADVRRRVSAWLQPSMRVAASFGQCFSGVREFFASRRQQ